MNRAGSLGAVGAFALLMAPTSIVAQEHPAPEAVEHAEHAEHEEHHHPNEVAVFLGVTHKNDHDDFTIGLDYERRLSAQHGVGLLVDKAQSEEERELIIGVPYFYHPPQVPGLKLIVAPGLEFVKEEVEVDIGEGEVEIEEERETLFLLRLGAGYSWEFGQFVVGPQVNWDIVEGPNAIVYGVSAGIAF